MSELAKKLIAENKLSKATFLDLGKCGLTELPTELGELIWLETLALCDFWQEWDGMGLHGRLSKNSGTSNENLRSIAVVTPLQNLRNLYIGDTKVADLAPLSGLNKLQTLIIRATQVTDLSPLSGLINLQTLDISLANVGDLSPLAGLCDLKILNVFKTQVVDLSPLSGIPGLRQLYAGQTKVADISPLAGLQALCELDVSATLITDLTPLRSLIIREIPVVLGRLSQHGTGIYVGDCPLTIPPIEIVRRGNEAILSYFREKANGTDRKFNRMRPSMAGFFGRSDLVEICSLSAHSIQEARMPQASGLHSRSAPSLPQRPMGCAVLVTN
jgi:Leucine-rich repeat (LRR) protein